MPGSHLALLALAAIAFGCQRSPILNHANADGKSLAVAEKTPCPLAFPKAGLCASLIWVKPPTSDEASSFTLRFWDKQKGNPEGPYLDPRDILFVKLWMPSMGHGSSPVKLAHAQDENKTDIPGVFNVTDVYFVMPGAWEIRVQLKDGPKVIEEAIEKINL